MRQLSSAAALIGYVAALLPVPAIAQSTAANLSADSSKARVDGMAFAVERRLAEIADRHFDQGEYRHAVTLYRIMVEIVPQDVDTFSNAGYLLWSLGEDANAIEVYKDGITANPQSSYMYDEIGQYYARKRNWSTAIPYLEKAATFSDVYGGTYHTLAIGYERTGRLDRALATWQLAIKNNKNPNLLGAERVNMARVARLVEQQSHQNR